MSDDNGTDDEGEKRERTRMWRERLRTVDKLLRSCLSHGAIEQLLCKDWDVNPRQVRKYIRDVYRLWDEDAKRTNSTRIELRRAQLEGVLECSMLLTDPLTGKAKPDVRTAVMALHRLCLVDGVYGPSKVEHSGTVKLGGTDPAVMRSSDREDELTKLMAKYREAKAARDAVVKPKQH